MRSRFRLFLIGALGLILVGSGVWFLTRFPPSADVFANESVQSFETVADLRGSVENPAELQDVTIDETGIHLAANSPTPTSYQTGALEPTLSPDDAINPETLESPLSVANQVSPTTELKYRLELEYGKAQACGGPVERVVQDSEKLATFVTVAADTTVLNSFLRHLGIVNDGDWTDKEKLLIVNESIRLGGITLQAVSGPSYTFRHPIDIKIISGFIEIDGPLVKASEQGKICPICLAGTTQIETPIGSVAVQDLTITSLIWTQDRAGNRIPGIVRQVGQTAVPPTHQMVKLVLADGRTVLVSPGHPTIAGQNVGELLVGDHYDGSVVTSTNRVAYEQPATYDILPSGPTGFYWANGIRLKSTLFGQ